MIPVHILRLHIEADGEFHFGRAPGSALRGALYAALGTMYDTYQRVGRDDIDENPVAWLLRLEDAETSGGKDVPRPLAVRPPTDDRVSQVAFSLAFYGKADRVIPMVLSAVPMMGELGIGRGRTNFTLRQVECVDALTNSTAPLIDANGETVGDLLAPPSADHYERFASLLDSTQLTVTFRTPTRIIDRGTLHHTPEFRPWFQRLIGRLRTISEVYMDEPVWVPFGDLLTIASDVQLVRDDTQWYEAHSGSRHDGMMKPLSGFVGEVHYEGDFSTLLPYLLLGQALQVGKNTIKGCGWYDITYRWA